MDIEKKLVNIACHYGIEAQSLMLIEEMAELTKAICKFNRANEKARGAEVFENLKEEVADVQIMLLQIQYLINVSNDELGQIMTKKLDRQLGRIRNET